jgi:pyridoxal phosphate enzyme (YggS family)
MSIPERLRQNLNAIFAEIHAACIRAGRDPSTANLVAVTKYADWSWVQELSQCHHVFGENRPQQLAERQALMPTAEWHLIGQLQRNKVRIALQHAALIHSVDSLRLLEKIAEAGAALVVRPKILLQLNVSQEASKSGFSLQELETEWPTVLTIADRVEIAGLMTMAAESQNPEDARPAFRSLRELRDRLAAREDSQSAGISLPELSMGMSGDFIPAVEEGATLVRIGSRIFDGLPS